MLDGSLAWIKIAETKETSIVSNDIINLANEIGRGSFDTSSIDDVNESLMF